MMILTLDKDELYEKLKAELNDQPTVEVTTNYLGSVDDKNILVMEILKKII